MRVRKLQRKDENGAWFDDCYAFENEMGRVVFQYNLAWGRVGAACSVKIRKAGTSLEAIETVIPAGESLRWLPIEVIEDDQVEAFLEKLNEACDIPKPRSVVIANTLPA